MRIRHVQFFGIALLALLVMPSALADHKASTRDGSHRAGTGVVIVYGSEIGSHLQHHRPSYGHGYRQGYRDGYRDGHRQGHHSGYHHGAHDHDAHHHGGHHGQSGHAMTRSPQIHARVPHGHLHRSR